jgi:transposase
VIELIDGLDLTTMSKSYRGTGSVSYPPAPLLGRFVHGYVTGVFSNREQERATLDSVAFRFIAANDRIDHETISAFRRRFLPKIDALLVKVLLQAREMGVLKMGTVALDGTKIHANASRRALSYEHAGKIEAQLKAEVTELLANAKRRTRPMFLTECRSLKNWRDVRSLFSSVHIRRGHDVLANPPPPRAAEHLPRPQTKWIVLAPCDAAGMP